jgi:signal transduction histidine kinase
VEQTITNLSNQICQSKATIQIDISEEIYIKYNKGYLESILQNILLNSIKYSHPLRDPQISISCEKQDKFLVLSISDNGLGIDLKKNKHKLFGMYKTFHGNEDALGLGLFMSKNQVEAMGGKIEVDSILDKGTTFKIYIKW